MGQMRLVELAWVVTASLNQKIVIGLLLVLGELDSVVRVTIRRIRGGFR